MNLIETFKPKKKQPVKKSEPKPAKPVRKNDETFAAIAAAIFLYRQEVHDIETSVLTIKRIDRIYSPWSSKIYGLRKSPR